MSRVKIGGAKEYARYFWPAPQYDNPDLGITDAHVVLRILNDGRVALARRGQASRAIIRQVVEATERSSSTGRPEPGDGGSLNIAWSA